MTNKKINPIAAGITGAVVGASAAYVASKVLSNKKAMKQVGKTIAGIAQEATDTARNYQTKVMKGGKRQIAKLKSTGK